MNLALRHQWYWMTILYLAALTGHFGSNYLVITTGGGHDELKLIQPALTLTTIGIVGAFVNMQTVYFRVLMPFYRLTGYFASFVVMGGVILFLVARDNNPLIGLPVLLFCAASMAMGKQMNIGWFGKGALFIFYAAPATGLVTSLWYISRDIVHDPSGMAAIQFFLVVTLAMCGSLLVSNLCARFATQISTAKGGYLRMSTIREEGRGSA